MVVRRRPQLSLAVMMVAVAMCGLISAGLLYGSRVPAVHQDWAALLGQSYDPPADMEAGRTAQLVFIMFTVTSPLILAGTFSTVEAFLRRRDRRRRQTVRRVVE